MSDMNVRLGTPVVVGEGVGHYWFPCGADRFDSGEIVARWGICADSSKNLVSAGIIAVSPDDGATWPLKYQVAAGPLTRFCLADGSIAGSEFRGMPDPPGQSRRARFSYIVLSDGGRRYTMEPHGVFVEGFPRDLQRSPHEGKWSCEWPLGIAMNEGCVRLGDTLISTPYVQFVGETKWSVVTIQSQDEGRTWRYLGEVFRAGALPDIAGGADEASVTQLENGDLLCVARTGSGQPLIRSHSSDGGRTWSPARRIEPFSVYPCLRRLDSGVLALSAGRPGLFLWLCTDGVGESWRKVDITAHHNAVMGESHRIDIEKNQTTAYTQIVPLPGNRLLYVYDRTPFGWKPVPEDSEERSRIYALPVDLQAV